MQYLIGPLKMWMGGFTVLATVSCSPAANLPGQPESAGVHLPSSIAQIVRPTVTIQSLTPDQSSETVHIQGTVVQQAPLLAGGLYQVQDDGGAIWVLSAEEAPPVAAAVNVVGTLEVETIAVEGIDISDFYLRETSRTIQADESITDPPGAAEPELDTAPPTDT